MSQNDSAVFTAAVGYVYVANASTDAPAPDALATLNLLSPSGWTGATGWADIGHTSRNDLPQFGFEGGDTEIRGSWQKKKLREVTTNDPIDSLTVQLLQFDDESLGLYYGPNASVTPGIFGVSGTAPAVEKALLVVIEDGTERLGFWVPKASIKRDDAIQLPIDDFAAMPIKATFLDDGTNNLFEWINEDLFNAA
jgi:hypothetical protein